jgi:methyl-accepting chemotaxis protein
MPKGKKPSLQDVLDEVRRNNELMQGHDVLLEEIRSQNRATIEAVEASREALEAKIDDVDRNSQARDAVLAAAVRQNSRDIRQNSRDILKNSEDILKNSEDIRKNSEDIRVLTTRVDGLGPLDQRVSALERRPAP